MNELTNEQKKAVSHSKGAACVIAGSGTGKTSALAERIFFLVDDQKTDPKRIIVTTFTRKATAELYDRAFQRIGEKAQQLKISTIDALIWDLARDAMNRDLMQTAQLIGEANHRVLLLHCAWEVFGNNYAYSRSAWTDNIDKSGLIGLLEKRIQADTVGRLERQVIQQTIRHKLKELEYRFYLGFDFRIPTTQDLNRTAERYYDRLEQLSATDYNLLSRDFLLCLRRNKKLAREFASQADTILVDEFQDTSRIQAEILLLLSGKDRNIWVVGDPCQQIYEWRGAGPDNLLWFIRKTKAKKYYLTDNWRSTQAILNCAYLFLGRRVPSLKGNGMLKPLSSKRDQMNSGDQGHSVYTATLERALFFVNRYLKSNPDINPKDVAILSRKLTKKTLEEIEEKAHAVGLKVQFHSSRADRAMERTIGSPPNWKPGNVLNNLYKHPKIQSLVSRSLRRNDFGGLRTIRPLATAAEALDSTLPTQAFSFREAWPALKITQDREVSVSPAVVNRADAIQVMTIHASKGLEFPIVLLMKLGKGGPRSFPNPKDQEDCRLAYVGVTRARDILILVHTIGKPNETLNAFGGSLIPIRRDRTISVTPCIKATAWLSTPPIISATSLDLYEQCPLKFAAYHEGRFLPKWTVPQSIGSRMHKALEFFLRADLPTGNTSINDCFELGFRQGDSPIRKLPCKSISKMKQSYKKIIGTISNISQKTLFIEHRYRYLHENSGQIDGVIDAVIQQRDGSIVLKEWKSSADITSDRRHAYTLQASAGALGIAAQNLQTIQMIEIVPIFAPSETLSIPFNGAFIEETNKKLDKVFRDLRDRRYAPQKGSHCKSCQLKPQCPAWPSLPI